MKSKSKNETLELSGPNGVGIYFKPDELVYEVREFDGETLRRFQFVEWREARAFLQGFDMAFQRMRKR